MIDTTTTTTHGSVDACRAWGAAWLATAPAWVTAVHTTITLPSVVLAVSVDRAGIVREVSA